MTYTPIVIESPYAGDTYRNMRYLDACVRDALGRGETPYASHRMLTSALHDHVPEQRSVGMEAGLAMALHLAQSGASVVFFIDYGWSEGMILAKQYYSNNNITWIERRIL